MHPVKYTLKSGIESDCEGTSSLNLFNKSLKVLK